jgi:Mn2+/Fe2+ NRAMP family transporter
VSFRKLFEVALGVVTSIGGFLEVGSIATAAQAGSGFGLQLLWPIVLGTICVIFLIEMSGRLAAVSKHPLPAAVRERFGFNFFVIPLLAETVIDFLVLASEIGGAALGLQLLTGISFAWWAVPVALLVWAMLWYGNFNAIEYGVSLLGLSTLVFVIAALKLHPAWPQVGRAILPSLPNRQHAHYWFLVVSILGATISPYLFNFYSSGAVEDEWTQDDLTPNRITAFLGMGFGGTISMAVVIAAAYTLLPAGINFQSYEQIALLVTAPLGQWAYWVLGGGLFIACFGAALELSLDIAYVYAQGFGWNWGENEKPANATRFSMTFTIFVLAACVPIACGLDPLKLTMFAMAATAVILPLIVLPFLVLMNDEHYVRDHRNGWIGNTVVFVVILIAFVIAVVAIPLEIVGGS